MHFEPLPVIGAFRIGIERLEDERGFFARVFCADEFARAGLMTDFVQRSVSFNARRGSVRGLHYQAAPHSETKVVRCTKGAVFDVIVDLRRRSPSFGRWHAEELTAENHVMVYIPAGCAHGFQTLADAAEVYYEIAPAYAAAASRGIAFDDPQLAIAWPLPPVNVSRTDRGWPGFQAAELFA